MVPLKVVKAEFFAKGTQNCKNFGNLFDTEVENLDDHGCPENREFADPKADGEMWMS